ncbi:MAG: 4Fe-4S dicluster domain-containing protein [Euryarchaeota archaeon]|nr:4Fe-4S dicluster domain-containing protein [Euryarchaeota archaeon]
MAKQLGFMVNIANCVGCNACVYACKQENNRDVKEGALWRRVVKIETGAYPNVKRYPVSMACMHCGKPPCKAACPVGAISKRDSDGIVLIDANKCIGCRYCVWACPYGAPQFDSEKKVTTKCTLCVHRIDKGIEPACVQTCMTKTLTYGDINELSLVKRERQARLVEADATSPSAVYLKP